MAVTATKVNGQFQFSGRAINITQAKNKALEPYNCIVHDYGITLELLPDAAQKQALAQQIGNARFVRNHYLSDRKNYYKATKKTLSVNEYKAKHLPQLKKDFPFLQESDKFALEAALEHVDAGYKNFSPAVPNSRSTPPSGNRQATPTPPSIPMATLLSWRRMACPM